MAKRIIFSFAFGWVCGRVEAQTNTTPIVATKPHEGRFVELPSGYMVAHTVTIPGTNIRFEMVSVPGSRVDEVAPFWIGKHEVTIREYGGYAKLYGVFTDLANKENKPAPTANRVDVVSAPTPVYYSRGRFEGVTSADFPAYSMTLFAAKQCTKWLSLITSTPYRLPTWRRSKSARKPTASRRKWSTG